MTNIESFFSKIYANSLITAEDLGKIQKAHQKIHYKKGDFILRKDETARGYLILQSGVARAYVYDFEGKDITTDFFCDGEIIVQELSLFKHLPSAENIQTLTDCTAWYIDYPSFQELYHSIKGYSEWGRLFMTEKLYQVKRRTLEMITLSAHDRYRQLLREKPQVLQKSPLKHIATYLGITDTSLSRIRKEIL